MNQPLPLSASVEVAASPEQVWEVVSDVRRMSEWSPECRRIVSAVKKAGVVFGVCHVLRYTDYNRKIKEVIDSGALG